MRNRSETFGRLLKGAINSIAVYEGKTAPIIENELAEKVHLAGSAFQRYKAGHLPPEQNTIEVIAEAAVRRAFLGREWLQRFLRAALYPNADKLLDRLCPVGTTRPRSPRIYQNLPAPTYSQFVMREKAFAEVLEGLRQRSAAVIVIGLGGNGKTCLAREVAGYCLANNDGSPIFDAVVWVSDKDRPNTTNLSVVLDEIAHTLDYPGFTLFEHSEKRREVEQLLRRQRVLVCVDNFETITDGALLSWLLKMPEPSKVLITSREYRREFRRGGWPVELRGMLHTEACALVNERLKVLRIEQLLSNSAYIDALVVATGGNPKAIEITLGLVKYERRSFLQVIDDLYAARGDLFNDLFSRVWMLLDEGAQHILLVMSFFTTSASSEALQAIADVQVFEFDRALERLMDLALLDIEQDNLDKAARYTFHPLVRTFAEAKLAKQLLFALDARERWVDWYIQLGGRVRHCSEDLSRLQLLDDEYETAYAVAIWAQQNSSYAKVFSLCKGIVYYFYVRGYWEMYLSLMQIRTEAARYLGNRDEEIKTIAIRVQVLSKQGAVDEARILLEEAGLYGLAYNFAVPIWDDVQEAIALHFFAMGSIKEARETWERMIQQENLPVESFIAACQSIGTCLHREGLLNEAEMFLRNALRDAEVNNYIRNTVSIRIRLAHIYLDLCRLEEAEQVLSISYRIAVECQERRYIALAQYAFSRLYFLQGSVSAAHMALIDAIDLFNRLGMRRELAASREELRRIDKEENATDVS